jgi:hypothetical protein
MLYNQINYLRCFLPFPEDIIAYCDKLITTPENGDLGIFDFREFLDPQKCACIKRSSVLNGQWKVIIYACNFRCLFKSKARNINHMEYL